MGMTAHDHVHTHIAQILGDFLLQVGGLQVILLTPVHVYHDGFGTFGPHGFKLGTDLFVEFLQLTVIKGVDQAVGIGLDLNGIDGGDTGHAVGGFGGVGGHAHLDAVDLNNLVVRIFLGFLGAQGFQARLLQNLQRPNHTGLPGVVAVVVAGEEHIKACVQRAQGDAVGAVEQGVAPVGVGGILAPEGGFQIGYRIVSLLDIGCNKGEDGIEDPGALGAVPAALDHGQMHQQVAGDGKAGGGFDHLNFRGYRSGGDGSGRHRGFCGQGGLGRCVGLGRLRGLTAGEHGTDQQHRSRCQDQYQQSNEGKYREFALSCVFTGHRYNLLIRCLWRKDPAGSGRNGRSFLPGCRSGVHGG